VAKVVLENIEKSFPQRDRLSKAAGKEDKKQQTGLVKILQSIDLTIEDGEFMVLVGPSGCGKSTLLRSIAGLEELTAGKIWVGDRLVNDLPPKARDIAMVFQNYALYPHLSVYDNIAFGLRRMSDNNNWLQDGLVGITRNLPPNLRYISAKEKRVRERVRVVAESLQIESLLGRLPKELSGGQRQRVALGRAIARKPQVFLMDEPLSNLDAKLRSETRSQIVLLQRQLNTTTIYVTHDQTEAMTMGDRIAVMQGGVIQQLATPLEIYNRPVNRFVAEFIGSPPMNFLPMRVENPLLLTNSSFHFSLPSVWEEKVKPYSGRSLVLGIRPEHLFIDESESSGIPICVDLVEALGNDTYINAHWSDRPDLTLQVRLAADRTVKQGEKLYLSIVPEKIHLFDSDNDQSIAVDI
jgi:multiple sugar transport system ATP-binding protein